MPICPTCGKKFSGFSFGPNPPTECSDCRKAKAQAAALAGSSSAAVAPAESTMRRAIRPVVTLTLVGLNALVYVAMGLSGVSWTEPSIQQAIRWGADYGPLTLSSEPWRLFTSTFVHFGIIHIGLNMWCLWDLGRVLEPLMGRKKFGVMYVASGLAASIVSVAWNPWRVSAGASGAIFGVAGAFVSYLALKKTSFDPHLARKNLKSMAFFIGYNLLRGLGGAVDNSAHLGGLVAGLILGAVTPPAAVSAAGWSGQATSGMAIGTNSDLESSENRSAWTIIFCSAALLILGGIGVHAKNIGAVGYGRAVKLIRSGSPDQGVAELQQVVQREPTLLFPQVVLGQALLEQQNPGEAVLPLERAAALDPNDVEVEHDLALAYLGAGRPADAEQQIGKAFDAEKDSRAVALYIRGVAEGEASQFSLAVADLRATLQLFPKWPEAKDALARFEAAQHEISQTSLHSAHDLKTSDKLNEGGAQPQLVIPYSQLLMKSEEWPLLP
ncbi:MAG TPA: rhomboid family intramembrane serine protease [Candidatus Acidoferrales bacterium]|nr:rhomboid family intramembrane serine protease [Candidatus Acidoferrales bacterium]